MTLSYSIATAADIEKYYGARQRQTIRAVVVRDDEEPVAIIGLAREKAYDRMFSEYKPDLQDRLKSMTVLRAIKAAMRLAAQSRRPILAVAEGDPSILLRVGFERVDGEVYRWLG